MNLLFVSQNFPYPPYRDGAYLKAYNLIRYLAEYNNIFLITFCNPGDENYIDKIASFCVQIVTVPHINPNSNKWSRFKKLIHDVANPKRFDSPRMRHEITSGVRAWKPDLVHIDLPMMSQYWSAVDNLPRVIASHDVISLYAYKNYKAGKSLFSKAMWYWLYKQRTWIETHFYPNYNVCTVVSEEDKELLEKHCPFLPIEVIPNGVDIEYFSPEKIEQDNVNGRFSIGLFGGMDFKPNVDAALHFTLKIYPLIRNEVPDVEFYIVGRKPPKSVLSLRKKEGVIVTNEVADMREYYEKTSVVVSPMRLGSGIKNTVLQAMSMAKPIVATPQAARAIAAENDVHLMIAERPLEFARKVICLLKNRPMREKLGKNARNLVVSKYSWKSHAEAFQKLYENILNGSNRSN